MNRVRYETWHYSTRSLPLLFEYIPLSQEIRANRGNRRNRDTFLKGHDEIVEFLTKKWAKENGYRLRKELFAFKDNKVVRLCFIIFLGTHCRPGKAVQVST